MPRTLEPRRQIVLATIVLLTLGAIIPGVSVAASAADQLDIVRYGSEQNPSAIVDIEANSTAEIEDWASASESRTLVSIDEDADTAVVAAPIFQLRGSVFDRIRAGGLDGISADPLESRSYVEDVSLNYQISRPKPVSLEESESFDEPDLPGYMRLTRWGESFPTEGLAFSEDANVTPIGDVRDDVNASSTYTGEGELVAVIDTGANVGSGEIFGNGTEGSEPRIHNDSKNMLTNTSVDTTTDDFAAIEDGEGHGTWVASAIASNYSGTDFDGVAPDADLLVLKALDDSGSGSTSNIAEAIRYAADHDADVISASLGSPVYSAALADAISYAQDEGSLVTVAVGNSRQTTRWVATPADVENVLGVGATTPEPPDSAQSAYFSQIGPDPGTTDLSELESRGAEVDLAAPGMQITAKVADTDGYIRNSTLSGTSMATPIVAGGATSVIDAEGAINQTAVAERLKDGARPIPNASATEVGAGMLDVEAAVDGLEAGDQLGNQTAEATERGDIYRAMSDSEGGWLARLGVGVIAA